LVVKAKAEVEFLASMPRSRLQAWRRGQVLASRP